MVPTTNQPTNQTKNLYFQYSALHLHPHSPKMQGTLFLEFRTIPKKFTSLIKQNVYSTML